MDQSVRADALDHDFRNLCGGPRFRLSFHFGCSPARLLSIGWFALSSKDFLTLKKYAIQTRIYYLEHVPVPYFPIQVLPKGRNWFVNLFWLETLAPTIRRRIAYHRNSDDVKITFFRKSS